MPRTFDELLLETASAPAREPPQPAPITPWKIGHFRVLGRLGRRGGVFDAYDDALGRRVALRFLPPSREGAPNLSYRAFLEARMAAALTHPNLVVIHEVGASNGFCYAAMELVDGAPLRELRAGESLDLGRALGIVRDVARGLAHAHHAGVVHGRLSEDDVLVGRGDRVKLANLGLGSWRHTPRVGREGAGDAANPSADVFALGVMLHDTAGDAASSPGIASLVERCFDPDPAHRFHDAHAFLQALYALPR